MRYKASLFKGRWLRTLGVGLFAVLCLFAISACGTSKGTVHVYDNAGVLDDARVSDAVNFPYNFDVYTTRTFDGTKTEFQSTTASKLQGDSNRIVMAIDTVHHYVYIARGGKVPLSSSGISQAVSSFSSNYHNGDYTGATVAALNSIGNSVGSGSSPVSGAGGTLLCVGLIILVVIVIVFSVIRRLIFGNRGYSQPAPPPYNPGYNQGPYYGPQQGGGMNPWAAGGLGAAAGGLVGYELGRQAGEREYEDRNDWAGGGGNFGGGGDFGGGDFGGGGGDFGGGGGDFGGGGGDFGGGGGGGDF